MTGEQLDDKAIFSAARAIESPEARAEYLRHACGGDATWIERVQTLLRGYEEQASFLESPPVAIDVDRTADDTIDGRSGSVIGPYKLLQQIGEGGMGVVYMAEQEVPVHRRVALKIIKPGMDTRQVIARFEAERQALASMDHPHVARVIDGGVTDAGRPYFVMDLVRGVPVTEYSDEHRLDTDDRLRLFIRVCQAVGHAHQKGIIHRDVKPSNILVAEQDGRPSPKIIDFGIAKAIGPDSIEPAATTPGLMLGTPQYMSPEQVEPTAGGIDTRSDVYSLGVVLYELLTGTTPLAEQLVRESGLDKLRQLIREDDPPRPSDRVDTLADAAATVAERRAQHPRQLARTLRGDLDWIVMKALEKDRARRYESPAELARDIERYLAHEPVLAGPPSRSYRLQKFVRRNRAAVFSAVAILSILVGGIIGTTVSLVRAREAEQKAEEERTAAVEARKDVEAAHARSRCALDLLTDRLIGQRLGQQADFGPDERLFLQQVEQQYQILADTQGDSESSRSDQANGNLRIAQIRRQLGDLVGAERCASKAIDLYQGLAREFPKQNSQLRGLATSQFEFAMAVYELGRMEEGISAYRASVAVWKTVDDDGRQHVEPLEASWAQINLATGLRQSGRLEEAEKILRELTARLNAPPGPQTIDDRYRIAICISNLGVVLIDMGRVQEAVSHQRRAMEVWDGLIKELPYNAPIRGERVRTQSRLGRALRVEGQHAEAEDLLRSVVAQRRQFVSEFPAYSYHQSLLANALQDLGRILSAQGRYAEAEAQFAESARLFRSLADARDASPEHAEDLAETLVGLARALRLQGTHDRARDLLEEAVRASARALAANPRNRTYQNTHHWVLLGLIRTHLEMRKHQQVARRAVEFAAGPLAQTKDVRDAAKWLLQCAWLACADSRLSIVERYALADSYVDRAIGLLPEIIVKATKN
jgi:serine/threonine protein kinase/tetratricopeptide (TPR) repeat protein